MKEWMHGCVMENVRKIKIKLENIRIDLIRSIYAPYNSNTLSHHADHESGSRDNVDMTMLPQIGRAHV